MSNNNSAENDSSDKKQQRILVLPQSVVDRIAAGEVVQRPAAAVKELLENCLDAGATEITVQTDATCLNFSIQDNGSGISPVDLPLAAVRHATSKLTTADDLNRIASFGFRGEALASISMVSRLTITSRIADSKTAFTLQYLDGKPLSEVPKPTARATTGTTVTVQDLFYNLPTRKRAKQSEEYNAILRVAQLYAIHYAANGVAFHCLKKKTGKTTTTTTDLNTNTTVAPIRRKLKSNLEGDSEKQLTAQRQATKNVIAQVFGSQLIPHLYDFACEMRQSKEIQKEDEKKMEADVEEHQDYKPRKEESATPQTDRTQEKQPFVYKCSGIVSSNSYMHTNKTRLVLFVNHRLIDGGCLALKRAVEDVYAQFTKVKPFVYLSLTVPPATVDVNVHPTKRDVALQHTDIICNHIAKQLKAKLGTLGQSFTISQPLTQSNLSNPYTSSNKRKLPPSQEEIAALKKSTTTALPSVLKKPATDIQNKKPTTTTTNTKPVGAKFIRTSRLTQSGSLEPFLVRSQKMSQTQQPQQLSQNSTSTLCSEESNNNNNESSSILIAHKPGCPLGENKSNDIDLTQPGAFALAAAQCTCMVKTAPVDNNNSVRLPKQAIRKLRKVKPTVVAEGSAMHKLRQRSFKQPSELWQKKLRKACFVGVVSQNRSLIQCGEELVLLDHYLAAQELFYQLALNRFESGDHAMFGTTNATEDIKKVVGVDVESVIGQVVQMEEIMHTPNEVQVLKEKQEKMHNDSLNETVTSFIKVSETNKALAEQAATCLLENATILQNKFSIHIQKDENDRIFLTGLPVLLEGYEPSPHGLPLFLLRLATEVDYSHERKCYQGICRELGCFYAQLPSNDELHSLVRHTIFPAVSTLLVPSQRLTELDAFVTLTSLGVLYRVFERC